GRAFVPSSARAWQVIEKTPTPRTFSFAQKKAREKVREPDTPYTPAHTLLRAMRVSLKKLLAQGIENVWAEQARNAAAARAGLTALGLELFPSPPNNALTAVKMPPGIDSSELLKRLEKN